MAYSDDQIRRIKYVVKDEWVSGDKETSQRNLERALQEIESPSELHQMAAACSWDTGPGVLEKLIRHPLCDKGTALMIYFLGKPEWYYSHLSQGRRLIGDQPTVFEFLKAIERMVEGEKFRVGQVRFDPRKVRGAFDSLSKEGADRVPAFMKCEIDQGPEIEVLKIW